MSQVVLQSVTKTFSGPRGAEIYALRDISLTIDRGELISIVGPSGSGKTTLLRLIAGLETPTRGEIFIEGKPATLIPPDQRDVAMVFQHYALYPHMTARENISIGLKLRKTPPAEIAERVSATADLLGLGPLLDRYPKEMSGGERQRVALARAIVRHPRAFLLDEPLANLDVPLRLQLRREIAKLHQRLGVTTIHVTHDQSDAMTLGQRIAVMRHGAIEQMAAPLDLYSKPANLFVARFIGSPPMNLLRGRLIAERSGELTFHAGMACSFPLSSRIAASLSRYIGHEIILGLRPESVQLIQDSPTSNAGCVKATVELIEPTGPVTYLHVNACGHPVTASSGPLHRATAGDAILCKFDLEGAHFFDPATELAIGRKD